MHYICDCVCVCISVCSYMCMGALPPSPWQGYVTLNESACFSALTYGVCSCVRMPLRLLVPSPAGSHLCVCGSGGCTSPGPEVAGCVFWHVSEWFSEGQSWVQYAWACMLKPVGADIFL